MTDESKYLVPLSEVHEAIVSGRRPTEVDPEVLGTMILHRLITNPNLDEVLDPEGSLSTEKLLDVPITLRAFVFVPSDFEESKVPLYAVLDVVDDDGVPHVMSVGGQFVMAQLARVAQANALPIHGRIIERGRGRKGRNRPLYWQSTAPPQHAAA
jgi:hypothetical protein